jgi:hypothetical protein
VPKTLQKAYPAVQCTVNADKMTVEEIKNLLMERGVKTRIRSIKRLRKVLRDQLAAEALHL